MQIHHFNQDQESVVIPAGQTVFKEGDQGESMFAVLDGAVEISIRGTMVESVGAGGVFGEMALVEARPRVASAVAKTNTRLVMIDRKRFMNVVQHDPDFALQLMTVMAGRLRKMDEKL